MANQSKRSIPGKAKGNPNNKRQFKIEKGTESPNELEVDIEIEDDGSNSDFLVDKFSLEGLPATMKDGAPIRWFNNFGIRRSGQYINQRYRVSIPGLSAALGNNSKLVIFDGNGDPYYYTGDIVNDSFELTDGDPSVGGTP